MLYVHPFRKHRAPARQTDMSHSPPPDRPASPSLAGRTIQPRFGQLEQSCRQLLMNHLDQHLNWIFEQADDALFVQADKATSNREQALFFDGMREIRKQRPQIIRHFHQSLASGFAAYIEGHPPPPPERNPLSLVAHEEHEENLLQAHMARRCRSRCAAQLQALEQRLAQLRRNPSPEIPQQGIPCAPDAIAAAFRRALPTDVLPLSIRRILYELFEQQIMDSLDDLYGALNQQLIDASILPQISVAPSRPPAARSPARAARAESRPEASERGSRGDAWSSGTRSESEQLFHGVTRLLSRRHGFVPNGAPVTADAPLSPPHPMEPLPPVGTYSEGELMAALTRLQQISAREIVDRPQQPQDIQRLKSRLYAELEAACTLPGSQQLNDDDADIIDLVGMLFAFILDDPALPDRCKTVLSHLHTPYLKLALRDRRLFTRDDHPARRLLDSMAKAGARFVDDDDASGLLAKMQDIVEHILREFSAENSLFATLLLEFEEHLRRLQQRIERRERRTLDAARGRDRLHVARRQADEQIRRVLAGRTLPLLMHELLEKAWCDVLALIHLRQGEQSEAWHNACQAAERLAWSCTPLSRHERERMQRERLELLEHLREGLQQLGSLADADIRRVLQDVVACQHAVQARQPELVAGLETKLPDGTLGALLQPQGSDDHAPLPDTSQDAELSPEQEAQLQRLQELPFGSLFGFSEEGQVHRLRLSWFSPASRHYLFIDPCGKHSRTWSAARLAQALQDGSVRLLGEPTDSPLMERALQAIYRVLQRLEDGKAATNP